MTTFLEIAQLENGDIVLRETRDHPETADQDTMSAGIDTGLLSMEAGDSPHREVSSAQPDDSGISIRLVRREPLVRIRFSDEVRDLLGSDLVGVAEAMIDAATDYLDGESLGMEADPAPVVH